MKKESYIQYGLIAIVIGLIVFRSREGFENFSTPTCADGKQPVNTPLGPMCETGSTPRVCQPGYTNEGGMCVSADGTSSVSATCPEGFVGAGVDKCIKREPAECPPGTEVYQLMSMTTGIPEEMKCVPKTIRTYEARLPPRDRQPTASEIANICNAGDKLGGKTGPGAILMCLSMGSATTSTAKESSPEDISTSKTVIQEVIDSLKPFRPPTAPASDLEIERRLITDDAKRSLYFIQVALFLVVLVMLSYFVFPLDTANLIAFALLSVGIAMGFFLRK